MYSLLLENVNSDSWKILLKIFKKPQKNKHLNGSFQIIMNFVI